MFEYPRVLHVTSMWPSDDRPHSGTFVSDLVEGLRRRGGVHDVLHIETHESKLNYLKAIPEISKRVATVSYDLIHAQYAHCGIVSNLATHSVPVISHFHGEFGYNYYKLGTADFRTYKDWIKCRRDAFLAKVAARMSAGVIVVQKQDFAMIDNTNSAIIPIGPDENHFKPLSREKACELLGWDHRIQRILFPGNPSRPDKNYSLFRDTLNRIESQGILVEEILLMDTPHEKVPLIMNACDLMLLTSYTEASPTVVKEANFCNLPIVTVPVGDVQLQLEDVKPACICKPDPVLLADSVVLTLKGDGRSNGASVSVNKWGITSTVDKTLVFYQDVLEHSYAHSANC